MDVDSVDADPKPLASRLGHWAAELLLVFLGAYAAFWLTNYQQHRADARRHDQLLAYLEQLMTAGIESSKEDAAKEDQQVAEFRRALAAGEMPPLRPFSFTTDYALGADQCSNWQTHARFVRTSRAVFDVRL